MTHSNRYSRVLVLERMSLLSSFRYLATLFTISALPLMAQFVPNRYTLILEDPPVSERYTGKDAVQSAAAVNYRRQIEAKQQDLRNLLAARNIQVTGSVSTLLNAIFVRTSADRVAELKNLPGVKAVLRQRYYKKTLNRAPALIDVPAAWTALGGPQNAGKGIKIGILDSGIDVTHPALQDSSLSTPAGFPKCNVQSDCANFTNSKVIVARSYVSIDAAGSNPSNPAVDDRPDDYSARDHDGHGTSVAAAAAGNSATGTVAIMGIAPKAYLGNYKISGSPGVNDSPTEAAILQALEDAQNDGMDVVSFSLGAQALTGPLDTGAACGQPAGTPCDSVATAFEHAAQNGLVIAAAGGNEGYNGYYYPLYNSVSSPGDAPDVISVGATTNAHIFNSTISVPGASSNLQNIVTNTGDSPTLPEYLPNAGAVALPLIDASGPAYNDAQGCRTFPSYPIPYGMYHAIALIEDGSCSAATKVNNAANAGAMAVIIYEAASGTLTSPTGLSSLIPTFEVSNSDGLNLKNYVDANPNNNSVTIDPGGSEQNDSADQNELAVYSSLGPGLTCSTPGAGCVGNSPIKPDLVAVGGDDYFGNFVYTAAQSYDPQGDVYSSNGYAPVAGTSFSTPMVAAAAAMIKQQNPKATLAQIRSALINTATQDVQTDDGVVAVGDSSAIEVDVQGYGGGKLDVAHALQATVSVSPVSLSFGVVQSLPQTIPLQITNTGSGAVNLNLSYAAAADESTTATVTFNTSSFSLAAGASKTVNATLSGTLPSTEEWSGFVSIQGSGISLTVPVMYLVPNGLQCQSCNLNPYAGYFDGIVGTTVPGALYVQATDDFGVPLANAPVQFSVQSGGGSVVNASTVTDAYGYAYADAVLSAKQEDTYYGITIAGNTVVYDGYSRVQPTIPVKGIVNAASLDPTQPIAPGSYIAIGYSANPGTGLSDPGYTDASTTRRLPLSIDGVIVSFDVPSAGISVPGHFYYVSPTQINVQVPWELQGQTSAQVKVAIGYNSNGNVVTIPISNYSPAFFQYQGAVLATDINFNLITPSNPIARGQTVVLYANGLGPVSNQPASGDPAGTTKTLTTPVVTIGGQPAQVSFSGLVPTVASLYQLNVVVPTNIAAGNQTVTLSIGGANATSLPLPVK